MDIIITKFIFHPLVCFLKPSVRISLHCLCPVPFHYTFSSCPLLDHKSSQWLVLPTTTLWTPPPATLPAPISLIWQLLSWKMAVRVSATHSEESWTCWNKPARPSKSETGGRGAAQQDPVLQNHWAAGGWGSTSRSHQGGYRRSCSHWGVVEVSSPVACLSLWHQPFAGVSSCCWGQSFKEKC